MKTIQTVRRDNARRLMREHGGAASFAALIGKEPSYVSQIIGANPSKGIGHRMARHIEARARKPEGWLDADRSEATLLSQKYDELSGKYDSDFVTLRIACLHTNDAGAPTVTSAGTMGGVPRAALDRLGITAEEALLVEVHGDAHGQALPDGSLVAVNTRDTTPREGKAYALRDDDMLRVRVLVPQPGGGLVLRTYNRAEYPDEPLTPEQVSERVEILGRVFWSATAWH